MRKLLSLGMFLSFVFSFPHFSGATVVKVLDLKDLIQNAKAVGLFKVVSKRSFTVNGRHVFTRYYLRALLCYAGCTDGAVFKVSIPGGKVSKKISAKVVGAPELQDGVNYVLLLTKKEGESDFSIAGFNQGAFFKAFDERRNVPYLKPLSLPFIKVNGKKVKRIDMDEFLKLVKEVFHR